MHHTGWPLWGFKAFNGAKERSKTFPGIAKAMASQWSEVLKGKNDATSKYSK